MKIYIVEASDRYGEFSYPESVFLDREKAEKHVELLDQLDEDYCYSIVEKEPMDDKIDMNASVMEYFWYVIHEGEEDEDPIKESEDYNDESDKIRKIYNYKTDYTEVHKDRVEAFSIHSFEKAKELAIKEYRKTFKKGRK